MEIGTDPVYFSREPKRYGNIMCQTEPEIEPILLPIYEPESLDKPHTLVISDIL